MRLQLALDEVDMPRAESRALLDITAPAIQNQYNSAAANTHYEPPAHFADNLSPKEMATVTDDAELLEKSGDQLKEWRGQHIYAGSMALADP